MKRILSLLLAWALILGAPLSFGQVSVDATKTGAAYSVSTWAGKPAATTAPAGSLLFASDVGANGSFFSSNGTRWRAVNGIAMLASLGAVSANVTGTEAIVLQTLIPVGAWQQYDSLRVWITPTSSGTTDVCELNVRVGTAGTTADTAITGLASFQILTASGVSGGGFFDVKLISATSAQKMGANTSAVAAYQSMSSTAAAAAATTITDASANALYVSLSLRSGGATNTCAATSAAIQLITP